MLNLRTGEQKVLVPGGSYPRYVPTGHIVYGVAGTLRAVAFDLDRLEVRSDPVPVLQRVVTKRKRRRELQRGAGRVARLPRG